MQEKMEIKLINVYYTNIMYKKAVIYTEYEWIIKSMLDKWDESCKIVKKIRNHRTNCDTTRSGYYEKFIHHVSQGYHK